MTNDVYVDDVAFSLNIHAQAKSLSHSLEQATEDITLYVKANKTESMCFKH